MSRAVAIVGAGIAGTAAAYAAHEGGAQVTLIDGGAGATIFGGGAVDDAPWELIDAAAHALGTEAQARVIDAQAAAFFEALQVWRVPETGPRPLLATLAGRLRSARGHDRSLLDFSALRDCLVVLPRLDRARWDADALARSLAADPQARANRLDFEAIDMPVVRYESELRFPDGDLAAAYDDDARLKWLAERIGDARARSVKRGRDIGAVLLGPWLGQAAPRAEALTALAGVAVGEALIGIGSPAGQRFVTARDRLLATIGARVVSARATSIEAGEVHLDTGVAITADAVVLAIGGVAGGGVIYAPPERSAGSDLPPRGGLAFRLSLDVDAALADENGRLGVVSSIHGPDLDTTAWPSGSAPSALETVGVACEGVRIAAGLFVAGDARAAAPRTLVEAVTSALRAGAEASGNFGAPR